MSESLRAVLRQSSAEEKLLALTELAAEVFATRGGPVALTDGTNRTIGYLSPEVSAEDIEPLTPSDVDEIRRRMAAPGKLLTVEQFTAELEAGEGGTAKR